jgi:hypothetical protein
LDSKKSHDKEIVKFSFDSLYNILDHLITSKKELQSNQSLFNEMIEYFLKTILFMSFYENIPNETIEIVSFSLFGLIVYDLVCFLDLIVSLGEISKNCQTYCQ